MRMFRPRGRRAAVLAGCLAFGAGPAPAVEGTAGQPVTVVLRMKGRHPVERTVTFDDGGRATVRFWGGESQEGQPIRKSRAATRTEGYVEIAASRKGDVVLVCVTSSVEESLDLDGVPVGSDLDGLASVFSWRLSDRTPVLATAAGWRYERRADDYELIVEGRSSAGR